MTTVTLRRLSPDNGPHFAANAWLARNGIVDYSHTVTHHVEAHPTTDEPLELWHFTWTFKAASDAALFQQAWGDPA